MARNTFKSRNVWSMAFKAFAHLAGLTHPLNTLSWIDEPDRSVTVTGSLDGVNASFTVNYSGGISVFKNGLRMKEGLDFTKTGNTLTFSQAPLADDIILAFALEIT